MIAERTAADLGWHHIQEALARYAVTALGQRWAAVWVPGGRDAAEIARRFVLIEEARSLLRAEQSPPLDAVADVRPILQRAAKGALLEPLELLACVRLLRVSAQMRRFFLSHAPQVPHLAAVAQGLLGIKALASEIEACIDEGGQILDAASSALAEHRRRSRQLHQEVKTRIEDMLHDAAFAPRLQDAFFTVRNERYVLPIKVQCRAEVLGIIHNASHSGQTVFVEPQALVPLGNELAIATSLAREEEQRILASLGAEVGALASEMTAALETLAELDVVMAGARLAERMEATVPRLCAPTEGFDLPQLRHPLLLLQGKHAVANDVRLGPGEWGLVVSGPNAGGKTVTITAVGLCAQLVRAGLPIPTAEPASLPLFLGVGCVIGDAQDLGADLSTFSAHLTELGGMLRQSRPGWLVLVDEITAGTDPKEGAALALSILRHLADAHIHVLVTTHLDEVKALGLGDGRFVNARVGLDQHTLAPTYALQLGATGVSKALDMAARLGFPAAVLQGARELLRGEGFLARALTELEGKTAALAQRLTEVGEKERALDALRQAAEQARRAAEETAREVALRVRAELAAEIEQARDEVRQQVARLQKSPTLRVAQQVQGELADRARVQAQHRLRLQHAGELGVGVPLRPGGRVKVVSLDAEGELLQRRGDQALVRLGTMRMRRPVRDLIALPGAAPKAPLTVPPVAAETLAAQPVAHENTGCDVRGLRVEDALRTLEKALDGVFAAGASAFTVVHGHGTGVLKQAVREALQCSPYVASFRGGEDYEGGDGLTFVELKR